MKTLFTFMTFLLLTSTQAQNFESKTILLSSFDKEIEIKLDNSTVKCSAAGYGASFLKVLIPELKDFTLFDHRNFGESAPCVAAGMCAPMGQHSPVQILDDEKPTEKVFVNVKLFRILSLNHAEKTCKVTLRETLLTKIRGVEFNHVRSSSVGTRNFEDCL